MLLRCARGAPNDEHAWKALYRDVRIRFHRQLDSIDPSVLPKNGRLGPGEFGTLRQRVAAGLHSTFASTYTQEVTLAEALLPASLAGYAKKATGEKYLVTPHAAR